MAEKDTKQDSQVTESVQEPQQKKVYDIKGGLKGRGRQIILTSLMMAITAVGALVTLSAGMSGLQASSSGMALFFGAVAFVGWIAMTALAVKNKDRTEAKILSEINLINIIGIITILLLSAGDDDKGSKIGYMLGYFSGSEDTDNRKDKW